MCTREAHRDCPHFVGMGAGLTHGYVLSSASSCAAAGAMRNACSAAPAAWRCRSRSGGTHALAQVATVPGSGWPKPAPSRQTSAKCGSGRSRSPRPAGMHSRPPAAPPQAKTDTRSGSYTWQNSTPAVWSRPLSSSSRQLSSGLPGTRFPPSGSSARASPRWPKGQWDWVGCFAISPGLRA